jgi:sporulation protein YlmC with PRC-barrel domain
MYAEGRTMMKKQTDDTIQILNLSQRLLGFFAIVGLAIVMLTKTTADAQVAGSTTLGVTTDEIKVVMLGWSAKKKILGKSVYNDNKQKIGTVDDLIITPDRAISYAIIGVGGFLGIGKHDVAIPVNQFKADQNRIILPGATKDALKAMPKFEYK